MCAFEVAEQCVAGLVHSICHRDGVAMRKRAPEDNRPFAAQKI
ncbi:MAG: hypothetical protein ACJ8ED_24780 [Xanthobacteraceae bacterium]